MYIFETHLLTLPLYSNNSKHEANLLLDLDSFHSNHITVFGPLLLPGKHARLELLISAKNLVRVCCKRVEQQVK